MAELLIPEGHGQIALPGHELERQRAEAAQKAADARAIVPCTIQHTDAASAASSPQARLRAIWHHTAHVTTKALVEPFCAVTMPFGYHAVWHTHEEWADLMAYDQRHRVKRTPTAKGPRLEVDEQAPWDWDKLRWCNFCTTFARLLVGGNR